MLTIHNGIGEEVGTFLLLNFLLEELYKAYYKCDPHNFTDFCCFAKSAANDLYTNKTRPIVVLHILLTLHAIFIDFCREYISLFLLFFSFRFEHD